MSDVFLSYAREDAEFAEQLSRALIVRGWSVWWDRDLIAGRYFDEAIEAEIAAAHAAVVLFSPASVGSHWVRSEAAAASERGILIPVLLGGAHLPLPFRTLHAVTIGAWDEPSTEQAVDWIDQAVASLCHDGATFPTAVPTMGVSKAALPLAGGSTAGVPAAGVSTAPDVVVPVIVRPRRRRAWLWALAATAVVALVVALAVRGASPNPTPDPTPTPTATPTPAPTATSSAGPTDTGTGKKPTPAVTTLTIGSAGPDVEVLQRLLAQAGYDPGPADGEFQGRTDQALRAFEGRHAGTAGVSRDGRIAVNGIEWGLLVRDAKTSTPSAVQVPDLTGLSVADATQRLTALGLTATTKPTPSDTVASGLVMQTDPVAGQSIAPGSAVTLVVSSGPVAVLDTPVQVAPLNGALVGVSQKTALTWKPVQGAQSYLVEILRYRSNRWLPVSTVSVNSTSLPVAAGDGAAVQWRVTAKGASGATSLPSPSQTFHYFTPIGVPIS